MTAILGILKFIGLVLLWLLAVVLILLLVVLICPVFYEISGEKYDKATATAKIKLLLGILSVRLGYDGGNADIKIKVFGKELNLNKKKKEDKETEEHTKEEIKEKEQDKPKPPAKKPEVRIEKPKEPVKQSDKPNCVPEKKAEARVSIQPADWENTEGIQGKPTVKKIKFAEIKPPEKKVDVTRVEIKRVKMPEESEPEAEKVKRAKNAENGEDEGGFKKNTEEERVTLNLSYFVKMPKEERKQLISAVMKLIKSVLKSVKPRDFLLKGKIGLSDPSLTGEIVGAAWALNGIFDKRIELESVFDREVIEGELSVKGHIVPAVMVFYLIRFAAAKPVRKIIKILIKGDKNGK